MYQRHLLLSLASFFVSVHGTIFLAGDSTTAPSPGTSYTGWGTQLSKYVSVGVTNNAVPGKSSRSFTDEGMFRGMFNNVKSGDVAVIEFGHNEGGGPQGNPRQGVCPGTDLTTTCSDGGKPVYTYHKYMTDAITQFKAKGAAVVIASQTPRNFFRDNSGVPIFVGYAQQVAMATNVSYVAHYNYTVALYNELGASTVNRYYTGDNIHTSAAGADMVAQAFVRGVLCDETNPIFKLVRNTNVRPAACLNATTPA